MKRTISLLIIIIMAIMLFTACSESDQQQSAEPTGTVISNSEQQEDDLFTEAAQYLNDKDYVSAHNIAEQSVSGKCKDAVEYAIADAFLRETLYGADVINQIIEIVSVPMQNGNIEEGLEAANSAPQLAAERIEPLYQITTQLPKDSLPDEGTIYYDAYLQALDYGKQMITTLPNCWNALGEQTEYMTEWETISNNYMESLTTALSQTDFWDEYFSDKGYTLPVEYRELLDTEVFFNNNIIASALKTGLPSQEADFRNATWGMSQDEVKQSESIELTDVRDKLGSDELSTFENAILQSELDGSDEVCLYGMATNTEGAQDINAHVFYVFNDNGQFSNAMVYMGKSIDSYGSTEEQNSIVSQLENLYIEKYGEPSASVETIIGIWETDKSVISLNCQTDEEREGILLQFVSDEIDLSSATVDSNIQENEPVSIPLEIEGIRYDTNSIGTPEVYIRVKNTGDVPIDAFDFAVKCLNNYGETVKGYGHEPYAVCTYQGEDGNIGAGEVWSASENDRYWTMSGYDTATKYEVAIIKVHTTDGETITLNQSQYEWIPQNE